MAFISAWPAAGQFEDRAAAADRVRALSREARWTLVASIPVAFRTFHPQGMTRVGDSLFVSSVEVTVRTRRFDTPVDGYDRDTGEGVGHLFRMNLSGELLGHIELGEGAMYHPGGIDFDGTDIWVPVAEYRPDSRSIVYRVDAAAMKATGVFRFDDHIGALVRNTDDNTLHGASWGSRRFYRWTLGAGGTVTNAEVAPERLARSNPSHYVDYQDCAYMGGHRMLCTGVADLRRGAGSPGGRLGGLDLVDLRDGRPLHQVPVPLWTAGGLPMTQNPVWLEAHGSGLRAYFMPEDDQSTLYIYDVAP
jgi:hypothetical protein